MGKIACLALLAVALAQPCTAEPLHWDRPELKPSAFAGLSVRLPLGTAAKPKPSLRLQISPDYRSSSLRAETPRNARSQGLEIGLSRTGQPTLFFNGRSQADVRTRLGLGGGSTPLIIGGVVLVVVLVAVAAGSSGLGDTCPTIEGSRDHCINP